MNKIIFKPDKNYKELTEVNFFNQVELNSKLRTLLEKLEDEIVDLRHLIEFDKKQRILDTCQVLEN